MKIRKNTYYVYIVANKTRSVLYTGITNDLERRLYEHYCQAGNENSFTGKYNCHDLLYYEEYINVKNAISREKQLKKWKRCWKDELITGCNPKWRSLNLDFFDKWPPQKDFEQ